MTTATHEQIAAAVKALRPRAQWALRGLDLEWMDQKQAQPSPDEIEAKVEEMTAAAAVPLFTPAQIVASLKAIDPNKATAIIENVDELTYARFVTATAVRADDPDLLAALRAVGITIAQLQAAIAG